jgi:uncharacterized protein YbjQ (UPF0145 family)
MANKNRANKNVNKGKRKGIKLLTTSLVDEDKYETIGVVMGVSVRAISTLRQLFSGVASIFGGRRGELEKKLIQAREEAIDEMSANANLAGADEVIGMHVDMSELSTGDRDGYLIVSATGTAVKTKQKNEYLK